MVQAKKSGGKRGTFPINAPRFAQFFYNPDFQFSRNLLSVFRDFPPYAIGKSSSIYRNHLLII